MMVPERLDSSRSRWRDGRSAVFWSRCWITLSAIFSLIWGACSSGGLGADRNVTQLPTTAQQVTSPEGIEIYHLSKAYTDGSPVWVRVKLPERLARIPDVSVRIQFAQVEFPLGRVSSESQNFEGLFAIPYQFPAGNVEAIVITSFRVEEVRHTLRFEVRAGTYPAERLAVAPRTVAPKLEDMKRIKNEQQQIAKIYATVSSQRLWSGPFVLPVDSVFTSVYGAYRVYNSQKQSPHLGLDLRARVGTPIKTPAPGKVVLAKDLFFTGNTVILDHGLGFFTIYAHLSKLQVKVGQVVNTGENLGLSGATGRVSGPHLHWGAVIQRVKVNPEVLLQRGGFVP